MARQTHAEASDELTLGAVVDDPLLLLNAGEEELRTLLERQIARAAEERGRKLCASYVLLVVYDEEGGGRGARASWGAERGRSPSGAPQLGRGRGRRRT